MKLDTLISLARESFGFDGGLNCFLIESYSILNFLKENLKSGFSMIH